MCDLKMGGVCMIESAREREDIFTYKISPKASKMKKHG